jgi:phytoene synthase
MHAHWENILISLAGSMLPPIANPVSVYRRDEYGVLNLAFSQCAEVARQHSRSFYLATSLLPVEKRDAVRVLYAFCRTVDDIVDEGSGEDREAQLSYWREVVSGDTAPLEDDLIARAWAHVLNCYNIPPRYALQLIDGVARDLTQNRYETFEDLSTYCYGVASTVGLMSMYIIGFKSAEALRYAINLGVALQLTNILRDVGEDQRNGRIYLPLTELRSFGISENELASGAITPKWVEFMKYQIFRVREIYAESEKGIAYLEKDGQAAVAAASGFYRGILDVIEANKFDVFTKRASLNAFEKISRIPLILFQLIQRT